MQTNNIETNFSCELTVDERKIGAGSFEISDFEEVFKKLKIQAEKAVELEISAIQKEFAETKKPVKALSIIDGMKNSTAIWIVLTTTRNIVKHVTDFSELQASGDLKNIRSIKFSTIFTYFKSIFGNREMKNVFEVNLDFSSIDLLDLSNLYLSPTPNQSNYRVVGNDFNWANGVGKVLDTFFKEKSLKRNWLYKKHTYNLFVAIFSYPISLWLVYSSNKNFLSKLDLSSITLVGTYIYIFFVFLFLMRIAFNFYRLLFPPMEITGMSQRRNPCGLTKIWEGNEPLTNPHL
jgi:hypothetical protein